MLSGGSTQLCLNGIKHLVMPKISTKNNSIERERERARALEVDF